jgi:hypothetical protein
MKANIKQFQSMILSEFAHHSSFNFSENNYMLTLGSIPKFDKLCLSTATDSIAHIANKNGKTLCGLNISMNKEIIGEILYCSRCLLYK